MAKKETFVASVLAFEKKLVVSDGYLYGTIWEKRATESEPLNLIEKSVRGTISNRLKPAVQNDPAKLNAEVEKANLQRVDSCGLKIDQDTLKLSFSIKVLSGIETPSACNNVDFSQKYYQTARRYIENNGFLELARRYATNIANGRYLWRNRLGAEKIEVTVSFGEKKWFFNAQKFTLKNFEEKYTEIEELANLIAEALSGKRQYLLLDISAYALIGKGQEVYPSEELILDKGKGNKSKILYQVNKIAAIHSQKLSNAIRTIDTWYPEFESGNIGPIAVEPYGAVTTLGKAYRSPKDKVDFYTLFDQFAIGEPLKNEEEENFVMAVLVRGGVFGQSSKE